VSDETGQEQRTWRALNIATKWRVLFTGWQLGTRAKGDPEGDAVRDHRELSILLRVEQSALVGLLLRKGVITEAEWEAALEREAVQLNRDYERRFPGVTAHKDGLTFDARAVETMKGWRP